MAYALLRRLANQNQRSVMSYSLTKSLQAMAILHH